MKTTQEPRVPKRLPCDVTVGGLRHTGLVLNVSPRGLFVQTTAEARPGTEVSIDLTPPNQQQPVEVRATVVWKRTVPRQMVSVARGGMGLRITEAPENYYSYLSGVIRGIAAPTPPASTARPQGTAKPIAKARAGASPLTGSNARPTSRPVAKPIARPDAKPIARPSSPFDLPAPREAMAPPVTKQLKFRVRVSQCSGSRSRYVDVTASSPTQASRKALKSIGDGWQVLEVKLA